VHPGVKKEAVGPEAVDDLGASVHLNQAHQAVLLRAQHVEMPVGVLVQGRRSSVEPVYSLAVWHFLDFVYELLEIFGVDEVAPSASIEANRRVGPVGCSMGCDSKVCIAS